MKKPDVVLAVVLAALLASVGAGAEEHSRTLGDYDSRRGYEWVVASRLLNADGSVKLSTRMPERLRKGLEWQLQNSAPAPDLEDGEIPSPDQCAPHPPDVTSSSMPGSEQDGRFVSALLLSEVAVTATVAGIVPGFFRGGNPGVLLSLSDVSPLHGRSASIGHVLLPVERTSANGRVFCAVMDRDHHIPTPPPPPGTRVVVMGAWSSEDVVWGNTQGRMGYLATVDSAEALRWIGGFFWSEERPSTLASLQRRVDEAARGGLFDVTADLVSQDIESPERTEFVKTWASYEPDGCRVVEVAELPGVGLMPSRTVCPRRPQR